MPISFASIEATRIISQVRRAADTLRLRNGISARDTLTSNEDCVSGNWNINKGLSNGSMEMDGVFSRAVVVIEALSEISSRLRYLTSLRVRSTLISENCARGITRKHVISVGSAIITRKGHCDSNCNMTSLYLARKDTTQSALELICNL